MTVTHISRQCFFIYYFFIIFIFIRFLYGDQAKFFEAEAKPRIKHKKRGTVSMANNGDNLHGSQVSYQMNINC